MKRITSIVLTISLLILMQIIVFAQIPEHSQSKYSIYLDGEYIDINNIAIDGTEYLPIKEMCEILGYDIVEVFENTYEITEGKSCKNSEGNLGKATFALGEDFVTTYSEDGAYANKIEMFPLSPITVKIGDEIYIPSYYFGRMLDLKSRFSEDNKIILLTLNYRKEQAENTPVYTGHIYVKSFDGELRIEVDGQKIPFVNQPFIDSDGRTQVAVRDFCEFLDKKVMWHEETQTVSVSSVPASLVPIDGGGAGGASYWFTIGEKQYRINGTYYDMDTAAQIVNDRTYVPLRYLAEAMNYYVDYNPSSGGSIDVGYSCSVLNSYMGLRKEVVLSEMGIGESHMLKKGDEAYPILQHQEGTMYIVKNGYKKGHVVIEFYNDVLCAYQYVFKTEGEAFDEAMNIHDYFVKLYGDAATYPGTENTISGIETDESQFNDEVCSYYDEWHIDASNKLIETMLGDEDNALMKSLKLDINPVMSTVRVNFSKDVNFHNRLYNEY